MRYDKDCCSVICDAHELCFFAKRCGDLGSIAPIVSPLDIADGKMYYKIQSEAGAYYNPNVELSLTSSLGDIYFTLNARADGIIRKDGILTVDKIKAVKGRNVYSPPDELTLSLLKISCHLLCVRDGLEAVNARVTYYNTESKKTKYFYYRYTARELAEFYSELLSKIEFRARSVFSRTSTREELATARFPYSELREGQEIMIREGFSAIKKGRRVFIEAPTGTGKTISALFPAVRALGEGYCDKIFYLTPKTATRKEAFSAMARLYSSGTRLKTVIITAKEQICPCATLINGKKRPCTGDTCEYARGYYDRIDGALQEILSNYTGFSRSLIFEVAMRHKVCPYELSLDLSELCDVVICDYNYVFDPIVYFRRYFGSDAIGGKYTFLIDEAHNLVDRARETYSSELSRSDFHNIVSEIDPIDKSSVASLFGFVEETFSPLKKLCKETLTVDSAGNEAGFYIGNEPNGALNKALERFTQSAKEFLRKNPEHYLYEAINELLFKVKKYLTVIEYFDESFRFYVKVEGGDITAKCYCLDPSDILDSLLCRAESALLFSATLTPPEYFCSVLGGGKKAKTVSLPSPFDPDRLCVAVADYVNTRFEDREDNAKRFATVIAASVKSRKGNYIAYFPSYKCLEDTYRSFSKKYPTVECVVQKKNMTVAKREEFLSAFKEDSGKLRVGFCVLGGVFAEGVDLPGSRLIGSIIFGVGLPALSNEKNIIREYYDQKSDEGIGYDYSYTFPGMNNVLQAAGRVIRRADDVGLVVLADDRYATPKYRELFPEHWKDVKYAGNASSLAEIMRRFWEKYPQE